MEISPHQSLDLTLRYMAAISQRQSLTSANIANAHTPNYTAKSVSFSELLQADSPFETKLSQQMGSHISEASTDTGMSVDLQKELIDMQKTCSTTAWSAAVHPASSAILKPPARSAVNWI